MIRQLSRNVNNSCFLKCGCIKDRVQPFRCHTTGFSLGLDDMEGDLSPPHMGGGTSTGGQSSNRGGRMGRDIYFMGGDPYFE